MCEARHLPGCGNEGLNGKRRPMFPRARRTTGLTLIEMTLVVATMALLMGFAVPAVRSLMTSFQTQSGVKSMIEAALSSARARARSFSWARTP